METTTKSAKTGDEHLHALRDGRTFIIDGEEVSNHVDHPAFKRVIEVSKKLYDFSADPLNAEQMTFRSPSTGRLVSRAWQLPSNYQELVERRKALEQIAGMTWGWVGRTPDHVASALAGMVMGVDLFNRHSAARGGALLDYFRWARDNDVWCGYAIVPPQTSRATATSGTLDPFINAGVCDEDHEGITIRGCRMMATALPLAQELLVAAVQPLRAGEEKYSFTAMVPLSAKGLKLLSRKSYEGAAVSDFDNPLSSRFDENDSIVYFDDVKIPWERVFVHNDVKIARAQWFETPVMTYQNYPAQIRLTVKLRFLLGLAHRIAEANGVLQFPGTQEALGQMAADVNIVEGMVAAMEVQGEQYGSYFIPNRSLQQSLMVYGQQLYPSFITRIRELSGGAVIGLPSSYLDFLNPTTAEYIQRTQGNSELSAIDRVKLFKLAWDAIGSEFGSRHAQYEMFYAGPVFGTRLRNFAVYDWRRATATVDSYIATIAMPSKAAT